MATNSCRASSIHGEKKGRWITLSDLLPATGFPARQFASRATRRRRRASAAHHHGEPTPAPRLAGAPLNWIALEPVPVSFHAIAVAEHAAHANAAKRYVDFILSREGQETLRGVQRIPVRKNVNADPPILFKGCSRIMLQLAKERTSTRSWRSTTASSVYAKVPAKLIGLYKIRFLHRLLDPGNHQDKNPIELSDAHSDFNGISFGAWGEAQRNLLSPNSQKSLSCRCLGLSSKTERPSSDGEIAFSWAMTASKSASVELVSTA